MHPTKKQMAKVIENFYRILPLTFEAGKKHLDYDEWRVRGWDNECGTVHCVAGWYAIATGLHEKKEKDRVDFMDGISKMERDLGFQFIENWAMDNPKIWGNQYGKLMFKNAKAWNGAKTIAKVIRHLEAVHDRLPK
jgi:hypothetical protein